MSSLPRCTSRSNNVDQVAALAADLRRHSPAELRGRLAALRQAKWARAARIEAVVARFWPDGVPTGRIAVTADCTPQNVRDAAKRLGLARP